VTLDHGRGNTLDTATCQELVLQLGEAEAAGARAVVLTGTGSMFSAGVDLLSIDEGGAGYVSEFLPALSDALLAVFGFPRPVVAAVNGHAIAGGAVLAFGADVRVMARGTGRIGTPELVVGVPFPRAPLDMVVYTVGEQVARRLVFGAQTLLPEQALELGVVDELAEPDALVDRAVEVATGLATSVPADTFAHTKAQLRRATVERIARYRVDEDPRALDIWKTRTEDGWMAGYLEQATRKS
jgi:enoyl-CoA hydratase